MNEDSRSIESSIPEGEKLSAPVNIATNISQSYRRCAFPTPCICPDVGLWPQRLASISRTSGGRERINRHLVSHSAKPLCTPVTWLVLTGLLFLLEVFQRRTVLNSASEHPQTQKSNPNNTLKI